MTVNFKTPEGLAIVRKLVERADVLVENFVSGKLASMGLGWEDCKRINERLIYASITGEFRGIWNFWTSVYSLETRIWPDWALSRRSWLRCCYRGRSWFDAHVRSRDHFYHTLLTRLWSVQHRRPRPTPLQSRRSCHGYCNGTICPWSNHGRPHLSPANGQRDMDRLQFV